MPASQGGAGQGGGLSWGPSLPSHLPSQRAAVPAAEPPSAVAPCTWLALLGAVHGCSIFRRATSGGRSGARDWPRRPSPSPSTPPRTWSPGARATGVRGELWRARAAHPLSLLGQTRSPAAGRGVGRGPRDETAEGAATASAASERREGAAVSALGHFAAILLRSGAAIFLPNPTPNSGPDPPQRHGRIFATRQV